VPLRGGAREPGHQRRPRPDLAHARAEGLRGRRGAVRMTAVAALPDRAAAAALRRTIARERKLYEVRRDGGTTDWRESGTAEPFDWAVPRPLPSAKRFFFPPRGAVLRWERDPPAQDP